jgi:hypothetical protein
MNDHKGGSEGFGDQSKQSVWFGDQFKSSSFKLVTGHVKLVNGHDKNMNLVTKPVKQDR